MSREISWHLENISRGQSNRTLADRKLNGKSLLDLAPDIRALNFAVLEKRYFFQLIIHLYHSIQSDNHQLLYTSLIHNIKNIIKDQLSQKLQKTGLTWNYFSVTYLVQKKPKGETGQQKIKVEEQCGIPDF